jgi:small-conductance mechanosensitive channel
MNTIGNLFDGILHDDMLRRLIIILFSIFLILLIGFYIKKAISAKVSDITNKYRARKATSIFGYLLIIAIALFVFSDKLGNIGIALGLAGAGIAFALQEVITSFAGWMSILLTGQIKVGQRVKIDNIAGDIIDIGVLKTTLMEIGDWVDGDLYNGKITTLSNSFIFKSPVHNYSGDYPFLWDEIHVPIRTESDFTLARQIFKEVTNEICGDYAKGSENIWEQMTDKYRIEKAKVEPMVTLKFDQNWITFTIRYVVDYRLRRKTKDLLFTRLLEEIAKNKDRIQIATSTLEVDYELSKETD